MYTQCEVVSRIRRIYIFPAIKLEIIHEQSDHHRSICVNYLNNKMEEKFQTSNIIVIYKLQNILRTCYNIEMHRYCVTLYSFWRFLYSKNVSSMRCEFYITSGSQNKHSRPRTRLQYYNLRCSDISAVQLGKKYMWWINFFTAKTDVLIFLSKMNIKYTTLDRIFPWLSCYFFLIDFGTLFSKKTHKFIVSSIYY